MEGVIVSDNRIANEPNTIIAKKAFLVSDPESLTVKLAWKMVPSIRSVPILKIIEKLILKLTISTWTYQMP